MSRLAKLRDEDGLTLVELLVAITIGMIVIVGILTVLHVSSKNSNRITARVEANQTGRPALSRIIDGLHSSCIGPGAAPVLAGSTDSQVRFLHATGSAVSPVPNLRTVTLSAGTLTDRVYPNTGGTSPNWTWAAAPSSTFEVARGVGQAAAAPVFSYYGYDSSGQLSSTPLVATTANPLSAVDALRVVAVDVTFSVTPRNTSPDPDAGAPISLSDTALLRFSPASTTGSGSLPCL